MSPPRRLKIYPGEQVVILHTRIHPMCNGRLVKDDTAAAKRAGRGVHQILFQGTNTAIHLPYRCDREAEEGGDLCADCLCKAARLRERIEKGDLKKTSLQGSHTSVIHGKIGEPIPFWSHCFGGTWYLENLKSGLSLSEEDMARAKAAADKANRGAPEVAPEAYPGAEAKKGGRKPKAAAGAGATQAKIEFPVVSAAEAAKAAEVAREAVVVPAPVPVAVAAVPVKKAAPRKKVCGAAAAAATPVVTVVPPTMILEAGAEAAAVEDIVQITVRHLEIDGRSLYLDSRKEKVYDMKFRYVGRYDRDAGALDTSFPDSDAE